jgi:hypothetical protein
MTTGPRGAPGGLDLRSFASGLQLQGLWIALSVVWLSRYRVEGDSVALVRGLHHALGCIGSGQFVGCGPEVVHFPLIQYVVAAPAAVLGLPDPAILRWLALVNAVALVVAGCVLVNVGRRVAGWFGGWLMLATAVGSPLIVYGASTFRESLSAALLVLFISAVLVSARPWLIFTSALAVSINQETFPPFVLALGVLAAWRPGSPTVGSVLRSRSFRLILAGVAGGVLLNVAFNIFRFASALNNANLLDELEVPRASWRVVLAVSLWLSPNGGLLWFWFVPVAILGVTVVRAISQLTSRPGCWRSWGPRLVLGLVAAAHTMGLASWWSPWGWYAWGPRLSIPLTAALALVALHLDRTWFESLGQRFPRRPSAIVGSIALVVLFALPHLAAAYDQEPYRLQFFATGDSRCPVVGATPVGDTTDVEYYYQCELIHRAWGRRPLVLVERGLAGFSPEVFPLAVLAVVTLLAGLARFASPSGASSGPRAVEDTQREPAG